MRARHTNPFIGIPHKKTARPFHLSRERPAAAAHGELRLSAQSHDFGLAEQLTELTVDDALLNKLSPLPLTFAALSLLSLSEILEIGGESKRPNVERH
jgi:hypothetical protein